MSAAPTSVDLSAALQSLFKDAYVSNCHIEGETLSASEEETLCDLSPFEVLDNLQELVGDLLSFKRRLKCSAENELVRQSEQFESMLQKLESEVRTHIRVEQQLKLHLETAQARVQELERKADDKQTHHRFVSEDRKQLRKVIDPADRRSKAMSRLEVENFRLRVALEEKSRELSVMRIDFEKLLKEVIREKPRTDPNSRARTPLSDRENVRKVDDSRKKKAVSPYQGAEGYRKAGCRPITSSARMKLMSSL